MKKIDANKLSIEINDTLKHRDAVIRSSRYLAQFLIKQNRSLDAMRLIGRCSVHDISKIQNSEEFIALASIVDGMDEMKDVSNKLSHHQVEAIRLHWSRNSHHPEYYENPNDMSDLDLLEMASDCHARSKQYGTSLIDYIEKQQEIRFHFDSEHYKKLRYYCMVLVEMTKNDDYSDIFLQDLTLQFDIYDTTMGLLVDFKDEDYPECIRTNRLYLRKIDNPDFASIVYAIYTNKDDKEVGNISLKCNGEIEYTIYKNYDGNDYELEAIEKLVEVSKFNILQMHIRKDNLGAINVVNSVGFNKHETTESSYIYRLEKKNS